MPRSMPHSPLLRALRGIDAAHRVAAATGEPANEVSERWAQASLDRRDFLRHAGKAAVALPAVAALAACTRKTGPSPSPSSDRGEPRIVIVGAGLAGVTAAFRLWQAGYRPTVYEASSRLTGRTSTLRDFFDGGQIVEQGGEFINSDHEAIIALAKELDLELDDLWVPWPKQTSGLNYFNGEPYSRDQAFRDYQEIYPALHRDFESAPWPTTWDSHTKDAERLDQMSLAEWVERHVPGGLASNFGKLLEIAYITEYGLDLQAQSALNLMFEMGYSPKDDLQLYGLQDWRYQIKGGNDQVVTAMAEQLPEGTFVVDSPLVALSVDPEFRPICAFQRGGTTVDVVADRLVLALPFAALRMVDLSKSGLSLIKRQAIGQFGMATNSKLHIQFGDRVWYDDHLNGGTNSDTGYQQTWEEDMGSKSSTGVLVVYTGGTVGSSYDAEEAHMPAPDAVTQTTLDQMEPVIPGVKNAYNGKSYLDFWVKDEWAWGSYACYAVGQWTKFAGAQQVAEDAMHFAGEHTSMNFQGFMNGAVVSGERVAAEILAKFGARTP